MTWGETREQALERINELLHALVQMRIEKGLPIPKTNFAYSDNYVRDNSSGATQVYGGISLGINVCGTSPCP